MLKNLDKIVALAGGLAVMATGGASIAAGAGVAATGASLLTAWMAGKRKHGPESDRVLARVRAKVLADLSGGGELSAGDDVVLEGAAYALGEILEECIPTAPALAKAFGRGEFVKSATAMIIVQVAERDDLFAETGERANPLARRFAWAAIEAAMETALTDQAYFAKLEPFLLEAMSQQVGSIRDTQTEHGESLDRIEQLLVRHAASPEGQLARREISDARPFILLARRINVEVDDADQALIEFTAMAERLRQLQATAERGTNLGDAIDAALRLIAERSLRGEFDSAAKEAESAFADWSRREAERQESVRQEGIRLIEANIEQNMFRRDPDAVAVWVERKVVQEGDGNSADVYALLMAAGDWQDRGTVKGLNLDLTIAAAVARRALPLCRSSDQRIAALTHLGNSLHALGDRESGTEQLEEAGAVFRSALQQFVREDSPREWAMIHNNLGNTLQSLGSRENGTARLEESVAAYREALRGFSREHMPRHWAQTQSNLGGALVRLAERTGRLDSLEDAVAAFHDSLQERTPANSPLEWADTQNNLGTALVRMWEQGGGIELVQEAAAAFRAVGEVLVREEVPLQWAGNQNNHGTALRILGEHEPEGPYLEAAEEAYRAALEEWTREREPVRHAAATLSLASTIGLIAARTRSVIRLDEADALARDARAIVVQAEHEPYVDFADEVLGTISRVRREIDPARAPGPA